MAFPIPAILQPHVVNDRVDRLKVNNTTLQRLWNMQKGGGADRLSPLGRNGSYDVFNSTRNTPPPSQPASAATRIRPQAVGNVPFQIPRVHPAIPLMLELLHNLRPIGGPVGQIDAGGQQYIVDQERYLKQQITNYREFQVAAMMRGSYYWSPAPGGFGMPQADFSTIGTPGIQIDYKIPSGNKTQGNMLGAGSVISSSWDKPTTAIVDHCFAVNRAFIALTGRGLRTVVVPSQVWQNVVSNNQVQNLGGSVNDPIKSITRDEDTEVFRAVLRCMPWLDWIINDNGINTGNPTGGSSGTEPYNHLNLAGVELQPTGQSFTTFIESTAACFLIEQDPMVAQYWNATEPISEYYGAPPTIKSYESYWAAPTWDPSGITLMALLNGVPVLQIPGGIAYLTVVF